MKEKVMLGVKEVMALTGFGRDTVYKILNGNEFPVQRIGKQNFVHVEVIENWMKGEKIKHKK